MATTSERPSDLSADELVVRFFARVLHHAKGRWAGQPFGLEPWQADDMIRPLYGTIAADGRRQYKEALFGIARKNGKSGLAAGLALWHLTYGGEAGGEVYSLAASRDQARIVYDVARAMVAASPLLAKRIRSYRSVLEDPVTGSIYRVLSRESRTAHGYNPNFVIVDELHCHPDGELYETMRTASGARSEPLLVSITTAGSDKASFAYRMYERGRAGADKRLLFRWWEAPGRCDLDDTAARAAANPASWVTDEFLDEQRHAAGLSENGFRRLHLNQWTDVIEAWLPAGAWDEIADPTVAIPDGAEVVLGFDGSFNNDSTALVVCGVDPLHLDVVECWERPAAMPDWQVPIVDVEEAIRVACRRWQVREIVCDPFRWARSYQILESERLPIVEFPQNPARMTPATQRFYEAVVNKTLSHSGDGRLARHVGNCVIRTDARGSRLSKESKSSGRKIDLAVAAVMAFDRAAQVPPKRPRPRAVWV